MGKGIAKEFKKIYPEMFEKYQKLCEENIFTIGKLWLYKTTNKWILNFPTKTTWRKPSKIEYIEKGLKTFVKGYAKLGITSIAFPPLGCGNGELNWEKQISPLMEKYLKPLPIDIFIYLFRKTKLYPEHKNIKSMKAWLRFEPETLGFVEVWEDLIEKIGKGITLESLVNKSKFTVRTKITSSEKGVELSLHNQQRFVDYEDLCELWNQIRSYGFNMKNILPASLENVADQLFTLLAKLPYCMPVMVNTDYKKLNESNNIGLQFLQQKLPPKPSNILAQDLILV